MGPALPRRCGRFSDSVVVGIAVLIGGGCDVSEFRVVPVSGRVTLNGRPLAGASVSFQPIAAAGADAAGPGSYGKTDADGKFELRLVTDDRSGAVPGPHVVTLSSAQSGAGDQLVAGADDGIPVKYRDGTARFVVPDAGTDAANLKLGED